MFLLKTFYSKISLGSFIRHPFLLHRPYRHSGSYSPSFIHSGAVPGGVVRPISRQHFGFSSRHNSTHGSLSINDSFDSSVSGGTAVACCQNISSHHKSVSPGQRPQIIGGPFGARPVSHLQRSHSDAVDHKISALSARHRSHQNFEMASSSGYHQFLGVGNASAINRATTPSLLNERNLSHFRTNIKPRRRTSNSLRDLAIGKKRQFSNVHNFRTN